MRKWDFDLCYMVGLDGREWQKPLAMFMDLYDALSYARRMAREDTDNGLYAVYRVEGDKMETIYVPQGQRGGTDKYPAGNALKMGDVRLISNRATPEGEGTVESPYLISSAAQLDWFSRQVNGGKNSVHGALTADITYNAGMDVEGWDGKSPNKFTPFTPIAMDSAGYNGTFDGRGHTISGVFADRDDSPWCGLFGNIASGGVVKGVTVRNSYFRTSHAEADNVYLGGVAGRCAGTVSDCDICATINAASDLSGIELSYINCGGIAGYGGVAITGCAYSGNVSASGKAYGVYCGGIAGICNGAMGCTSSGRTIANGAAMGSISCGGMAGYCFGAITDCASSGSVVSSGTAEHICCGGMMGCNDDAVTGCTFSGDIGVSGTAKGSIHCGGMAGSNDGTITGCASSGSIDVSGTAAFVRCGGIAGHNTVSVTDCAYSGNIDVSGAAKGNIYCGGMAGSNDGATINCASSGSTIANGTASGVYCGGMVGYCGGNGTVKDCAFTGDILANSMAFGLYCGGIAGYVAVTGTVMNCMSQGNVDAGGKVTDNIYCGGVTGYVRGSVTGCTSSGSVDTSGKAMYIRCGGISGCVYGTVMDCIASGTVSVSGTARQTCRDIIAGHVHDDGTVKNCVAKDDVDLRNVR